MRAAPASVTDRSAAVHIDTRSVVSMGADPNPGASVVAGAG